MREALEQVATVLSRDANDARLLRLTSSAVYAPPRRAVVIRAAPSYTLRDRVARTVRPAEWFVRVDAPTVYLLVVAAQVDA